MSVPDLRKLNTFSLAALLVSAHYGLGFLLGTAEQTLTDGFAGSLYTFSLAFGTIVLLLLAQFYWVKVEQIWTLLGECYGYRVRVVIGLMSWTSLIGIEAVQIISGAFILKVLQVPTIPSMIGLVCLAAVLSLVPTQRIGQLFKGLLVFNILLLFILLYALHGFPAYLRSPIEFWPALSHLKSTEIVSISLPTVLLMLIDMKYHQFLVQATTLRTLYQGCLLATLVLFLLAFLPSAVVMAAQAAQVLPDGLEGKELIPYLLAWLGGGPDRPLGVLLILSLLIPALGVGSSVLRVQTKTILDLGIFPKFAWSPILITGINALLGLAVALKGGSIVGLIVQFYSVYISGVWVPFLAYLIALTNRVVFSQTSILLALTMGSVSGIATLITTIVLPSFKFFDSVELTILALGVGFSFLGLLMGEVLEQSFNWWKTRANV